MNKHPSGQRGLMSRLQRSPNRWPDPLADWNDSGVIDASDIEAFAIELAAGC